MPVYQYSIKYKKQGRAKLKNDQYDLVILIGPVWMGKFISPLKDFVIKHGKSIKEMMFITCCGSSYEMKDKKFGHGLVFKEVEELLNDKCIHCEAFPITLIVPDDKKEDPNVIMNTRLTEESFRGEIRERFDKYINQLNY